MGAESPEGWSIEHGSAENWGFADGGLGENGNVSPLSSQALEFDTRDTSTDELDDGAGVILPEASDGNITEARLEFSAIIEDTATSAGLVFAYQDIDNFYVAEAHMGYKGHDLGVGQVQNGVYDELYTSDVELDGDPENKWQDIRIQLWQEDNDDLTTRLEIAEHQDDLEDVDTYTISDPDFTTGDVGLVIGLAYGQEYAWIDGDEIGTGGRPIQFFWD